jgi:hypothetical protein
MASALPTRRQARRAGADRALARSGGGGKIVAGDYSRGHVDDGLGGAVSLLSLSALVRQPGGRTELADPGRGPVISEAAKDVAEILEGRSADEVAVEDQGVQDREAARGVVGACEQKIPSADGESPFILPMLANAPSSTTGGTLRSAPRSASRIVSIAAAKTSPCSTRATELARCCQLGCSTPASARR